MRERIYEIRELDKEGDKASKVYDLFMMTVIIISILPLAFKEDYAIFAITDVVVVSVFIIDYLLNWMTPRRRSIWISSMKCR